MPFQIGIDEAGYGPNLGPLVISATVWRIDGDCRRVDLYQALRRVISRQLDNNLVAIADSKVLYKPGSGLAALERAVLPALALQRSLPANWRQIWDDLGADQDGQRDQLPWYAQYDAPLPVDIDVSELHRIYEQLASGLAARGTELVTIQSRAVLPDRFNRLIREYGTKSGALSRTTLQLLADVMAPLQGEEISVVCDKHGARNRYQSLLQEQFPDYLVEVRGEARKQSLYQWGPAGRRVEVCFRAGGEAFLPAALASMVSKYLRELAMRAFNDYWCGRVVGLRPTAGYPVDARRFKQQITACQHELGIDDRVLWRTR